MKRKTNLFYTTGPDSKFITFSNYTESMTGNFLSTDTKLFPSRFMCANINGLTESKKTLLIKGFVEYYESKLAALRDSSNVDNENNVLPLHYLIEYLYSIKNITSNSIEYFTVAGVPVTSADNIVQINYISDITEQDYRGQYADMIFCVDLDNYHVPTFTFDNNYNATYGTDIDITHKLYGWNQLFNDYSESIFDEIQTINNVAVGQYHVNSHISNINITEAQNKDLLSFNIIIPLFDLCDINKSTNNVAIDDLTNLNNANYNSSVPLGIWFSDNCENIVIKRDIDTGYACSWSLTLSSQFKPFPTSSNIVNESDKTYNTDAYKTFSQLLVKQNQVLDKMDDLSYMYVSLNNRMNKLETIINKMGTSYNIDNIQQSMVLYSYNMNTEFNTLKTDIVSYLNGLQWKQTI